MLTSYKYMHLSSLCTVSSHQHPQYQNTTISYFQSPISFFFLFPFFSTKSLSFPTAKMKVTAAATLLVLTTPSSAAPATRHVRRQAPSGLDVINSVNSWTNDVIQVNSFLNTASTLSGADLAAAAQTAFGFASDEPVQLMLEGGLPG